MPSGAVVALYLKPAPGQLQPVDQLQAKGGSGFVGDRCFGRTTRQALLISTENLSEFGYKPGELREQITVDLPGLQLIPVGTRIKVGEVTVELEEDCTPCTKMAKYLAEDPQEFIAKTQRKRGMLAKVITDGTIRVGDRVEVESA